MHGKDHSINATGLSKNSTKGTHKQEGNLGANKALTHALGLRSDDRPNWSCCHIWGVDDARYQSVNLVVQDHRFFSCVGNMVLLPTPLKAFDAAFNLGDEGAQLVFRFEHWDVHHSAHLAG